MATKCIYDATNHCIRTVENVWGSPAYRPAPSFAQFTGLHYALIFAGFVFSLFFIRQIIWRLMGPHRLFWNIAAPVFAAFFAVFLSIFVMDHAFAASAVIPSISETFQAFGSLARLL